MTGPLLIKLYSYPDRVKFQGIPITSLVLRDLIPIVSESVKSTFQVPIVIIMANNTVFTHCYTAPSFIVKQ
jgi:hypothetical protein